MKQKDGTAIRASLFTEDGIYAENELYTLRAIRESDKEDYLNIYRNKPEWIMLFQNPQVDAGQILWDGFINPDVLNTVIVRKADAAFCGFCGLQEFLTQEAPELSLELVPECRHQGIGSAVLPMLMKRYTDVIGTRRFIGKVRPDNLPSQGLVRKLGGIPAGIAPYPGADELFVRIMEESEEPQPEYYTELAQEFGATLQQLRSHVLVFVLNN